ncbi:type IV secretory system conjugative DNA transfer family protein [Nitrospirillum bahiense]|uniref:Type IV secretion system protein VirD4 n=1 Tax=Nitrospirillum amazonense TaxID=28077 RepID=A0A560FHP8_9PROT|nr:type IV secretory system conjugative DNA transfer family protein [Nitrospirillum amazonense]TWB21106.1 type IV secretion system protein VirD4 [Nitrospirillum amazonense]
MLYDLLSLLKSTSPYLSIPTLGGAAAFAASELRQDLRARVDETASAHGSARWATFNHLRRAGLLGNDGLVLGRWPGRLISPLLRVATDRHLLTIAPTRSGKGVSAVIPNLLTYPGSALVIDPKGENAKATALRRAAMGQEVHILDPWGITHLPASALNPLDPLDGNSADVAEDVMLIADALVPAKGASGLDPFWDTEAKALIGGLLLHILAREPPARRTLPRLRQLLTLDPAAFAALLDDMAGNGAIGGLVARAANRIKQKPDKERASVLSAAQAHTHFLDSPRMADVLSRSDFDLADLKRRAMTIYLVLPSSRLTSYARWLRLLVSLALAELSGLAGRPAHPVLFLLDEFAALGRLDMIETALGLLAGYGVQLWPIVQDLSQLRDLYRERWSSFIANAGVIQVFGVNDPATAETVSRMLGARTASVRSESHNARRQGKDSGVNYSTVARPLLYAAEVARLPETDELLFVNGLPPIRARKLVYYKDRRFRDLVAHPEGA